MATENVSKLVPAVIVGARSGQVSVTKLVAYAIVNSSTPGPPPTARRRMRVSALVGRFRSPAP
jgi:hypothetical protein